MTLLYRVEDEICIEMSPATWAEVEKAVNHWRAVDDVFVDRELECFANKIRAHLQHLKPRDNSDLA